MAALRAFRKPEISLEIQLQNISISSSSNSSNYNSNNNSGNGDKSNDDIIDISKYHSNKMKNTMKRKNPLIMMTARIFKKCGNKKILKRSSK